MIDTHAHLEEILCDVDKGIDKIILAGANLETSKNNLILAEKYLNKLFASVGIHPQEINDSPVELKKIVDENYEKIVAIGECGLDFSGDFDKDKQISVFKSQIELAKKYKKPLLIHARKAVDEVIKILGEYKNIYGVFHCYAGGNKRIKKILEMENKFYFGIDGNLTYEDGLVEVVKNIPKDRLLLETDCPCLTPVPFRGEINSPKNVEYIYKKVAEIWGMSFKETEKIIDRNAKKLFKV